MTTRDASTTARARQTCVIGGWTDPKGSRPFFGTLLLGRFEQGALRYVGETGAGIEDSELGRIWKLLRPLRTRTCPFREKPQTKETAHWVQPTLTVEVSFTGMTVDGRLKRPRYEALIEPTTTELLGQIDALQLRGGSGALELPDGNRLEVSNLSKVFWPKGGLTKGDLMRHYVRMAPYILPVLEDRPLVMKRFPNGVAAKPFYQHRAPDRVPAGVLVKPLEAEGESRSQVIGGSLTTLLYTAQLAAISQDPWLSRVGSDDMIDHIAIDLDPPDGLPFARVRDVARWVHDELDLLKAPGFPKTSGAGGLHVYVPMPPRTPFAAGYLFAQIVATRVAQKHPKTATVERAIKARGNRIYVDFMQNARGKTLASAYSARASDFAGVSTPLTWAEIDTNVTPADFTIATFAERIEQVGDLWAALRTSAAPDLIGLTA